MLAYPKSLLKHGATYEVCPAVWDVFISKLSAEDFELKGNDLYLFIKIIDKIEMPEEHLVW